MKPVNEQLPFADQRTVYTVSALNHTARDVVESALGLVWVEGEISNLARPVSGHMYFSLKDEHAQVRCAMFRQHARRGSAALDNGRQVLVRGRVSIYAARGDYQIIVEQVEEAGIGALQRRFEELRAKLAAEGLFETQRKKALPALPTRIGIITSASGAALHDVLTALRRRFAGIAVLIYPSAVQGNEAPGELARALDLANERRECDLLILTRGGGSIEDLWAFNEEVVARAIARSDIPIISGVGHETDFTIADFVADLRAPTPSQAAELAAPPRSEFEQRINHVARRLAQAVATRQRAQAHALAALELRLQRAHPGAAIREFSQRLDDAEHALQNAFRQALARRQRRLQRLELRLTACHPRTRFEQLRARVRRAAERVPAAVSHRMERAEHRLRIAERALQSLSPLATLERGYAIVTDENGQILRRASDTSAGAALDIRLRRGRVEADVTGIHDDPDATSGEQETLRN